MCLDRADVVIDGMWLLGTVRSGGAHVATGEIQLSALSWRAANTWSGQADEVSNLVAHCVRHILYRGRFCFNLQLSLSARSVWYVVCARLFLGTAIAWAWRPSVAVRLSIGPVLVLAYLFRYCISPGDWLFLAGVLGIAAFFISLISCSHLALIPMSFIGTSDSRSVQQAPNSLFCPGAFEPHSDAVYRDLGRAARHCMLKAAESQIRAVCLENRAREGSGNARFSGLGFRVSPLGVLSYWQNRPDGS